MDTHITLGISVQLRHLLTLFAVKVDDLMNGSETATEAHSTKSKDLQYYILAYTDIYKYAKHIILIISTTRFDYCLTYCVIFE